MELRTLRYFVAVAEERNIGRAAARLGMTQPPLSRAIQQLERELRTPLLHRSRTGVDPTEAGVVLLRHARRLLAQADRVPGAVGAVTSPRTLLVGTLLESPEGVGHELVNVFRTEHPDIDVIVREADITDPTAGLRLGVVDVALTRTPFDDTGISTQLIASEQVHAILRTDDPLAARDRLAMSELAGRRWFQFPPDVDPVWRSFWLGQHHPGGPSTDVPARSDGPVVRTSGECLQAVLWNDTIGLAPPLASLPPGLSAVPVADFPTTDLVVAWRTGERDPLVHGFVASVRRTARPQAGAR